MNNWTGCLRNRSYRDLVRTIATYERRGKVPLVRDLGTDLKRSAQILHVQLQNLTNEGYILMGGGHSQTKLPSLTDEGRKVATHLGAPILGEIPAGLLRGVPETDGRDGEGAPIFCNTWDEELPPTEDYGVMLVRGDSMIGEGIKDGDKVHLELGVKLHQLEQGEIAAVMVGEEYEATLKYVFVDWKTKGVTLRAANPAYPDIHCSVNEVRVTGAFYGLIRVGHRPKRGTK